MRTIAIIQHDIAEAEALANSDLKGNKVYTGEQRKALYRARVKALKVELENAIKARDIILGIAKGA